MTADVEVVPGDEGNALVQMSNGDNISMQAFQQAYKELTGKSESLSKNYKVSFKVDFNDLEQLNSTIEQLLEQYHVKERSCSISVYHIDDSKESYSSFDRFRIYETGALSPVENIVLEYRFLVILPLVNKPQVYKVSIDLMSRVGMIKKAKEEESFFGSRFFYFYAQNTATVSIEFVDYAVARNFRLSIDHWVNSLRAEKKSSVWIGLRKCIQHFPFIFKYATALVVACFSLWYLNEVRPSPRIYSYSVVLLLSIIYISAGMAAKAGELIANAVERYLPISYVKLVRGDEEAIKEFDLGNRVAVAKIIGGLLFTIGINVFSNWLSKTWGF
ncbi:hypothetical protein K6X13_09550 [Xanthomonas euvesicatoria pv. allii]|uniref:hypothetical protein n=1 Tax=Xanthomonas euvesicatoria TaxID=456327 RepID=UPI0024059882|nr:hypothetical protein [Xanthomonas euvesicatoria]MCP3047341.1 hypothetical protein [Xanthomonas euvesicatoria pv. allii]